MASISEALVATAVGIGVAIPAVAANNLFQRVTKATLANTEALTRIVLAHLKSPASAFAAPEPAPEASPPAKKKTETKADASKSDTGKGKPAKGKPEPKEDADEQESE